MADNVIEARGLSKRFGDLPAVEEVDLAVQEGEIFGLIGHNGAGKSTLFRMMLGLVEPSAGEVRVQGRPVHGRGFRDVRRRIGYLPENVVLYDNLTGLETLHFFAQLKGAGKGGYGALLETVGLREAANRPVKGYSKGMLQRLGFAQALLGDPALLFLDEPTNGLDPEGIRDFYRLLRKLKERGVTAILTSHILAEIQERVDRLAIMRNGRIQAVGTVQALRTAVQLPVRVDIRVCDGAASRVADALSPLEPEAMEFDRDLIRLRCRPDAKLQVLSALASVGDGAIADVQIREASLEDVFFGYSAEG